MIADFGFGILFQDLGVHGAQNALVLEFEFCQSQLADRAANSWLG